MSATTAGHDRGHHVICYQSEWPGAAALGNSYGPEPRTQHQLCEHAVLLISAYGARGVTRAAYVQATVLFPVLFASHTNRSCFAAHDNRIVLWCEQVTVLFADLDGFWDGSMAQRSTTEAVTLMNEMYSVFEKLLAKHQVGVLLLFLLHVTTVCSFDIDLCTVCLYAILYTWCSVCRERLLAKQKLGLHESNDVRLVYYTMLDVLPLLDTSCGGEIAVGVCMHGLLLWDASCSNACTAGDSFTCNNVTVSPYFCTAGVPSGALWRCLHSCVGS